MHRSSSRSRAQLGTRPAPGCQRCLQLGRPLLAREALKTLLGRLHKLGSSCGYICEGMSLSGATPMSRGHQVSVTYGRRHKVFVAVDGAGARAPTAPAFLCWLSSCSSTRGTPNQADCLELIEALLLWLCSCALLRGLRFCGRQFASLYYQAGQRRYSSRQCSNSRPPHLLLLI